MESSPDITAPRPVRAVGSRLRIAPPWSELIRYGAASGLALAADFGTLVVLTEIGGLHYMASAVIGFGLGILVAYVLSVRWVFAARRLNSVAAESAIFLAVGLAGLAINQIVIYSLTESALLPYTMSKVVSAGIVFTFNFSVRKLALFTAPAARQEAMP